MFGLPHHFLLSRQGVNTHDRRKHVRKNVVQELSACGITKPTTTTTTKYPAPKRNTMPDTASTTPTTPTPLNPNSTDPAVLVGNAMAHFGKEVGGAIAPSNIKLAIALEKLSDRLDSKETALSMIAKQAKVAAVHTTVATVIIGTGYGLYTLGRYLLSPRVVAEVASSL
jgi:hypothetical protein